MDGNSPLTSSDHHAIEMLLPWYVTGQLDAAEADAVDGHLADCGQCRTLLAEERELRDAVAALPFTTRSGNPQTDLFRPAARRPWARVRQAAARPRKAAWFLSAQAVMVLTMFVILQPSPQSPPAYRTLGAAPGANAGNAVVIFQPTTTEAVLRQTLKLAGATIVDGPNAAGAYTLRIAPPERARQLKLLRSQPSVVLAEAVDGEANP